MGRKSLISILIIVSMGNVLAQNIKNFPSEFKNKVFCGEAKLNGTNGYSKSVSFFAVPFKLTISDEIIEFSVEYEGSWQVCQTFDKINALFTKSGTDVMYDSFDFSVGVNNESIESQNRKPIMTLKSLSVKVVNPNFVMTPTLMRAGLNAPSKNWITCNIEYGRMSGGHKPLYVENICGEYLTAKMVAEAEKLETEKKEKYAREQKSKDEVLAKEKLKEMKIVTRKLDSLIRIKDFQSASELYIAQNGTLDISSYFSTIEKGLTDLISRDTMLLGKAATDLFIEQNKGFLKKLSDGDFFYYFDNKGTSMSSSEVNLDPKLIPIKTIGNKNLKAGDRYLGGIVIFADEKEIVVTSSGPIGMTNYSSAIAECNKYRIGNMNCRLPSRSELELIFKIESKLDSFDNRWPYWSLSGSFTIKNMPLIKRKEEDLGEYGLIREMIALYEDMVTSFYAVRTVYVNSFSAPQNTKIKLSVVENKDVIIKTEYFSSSSKPVFFGGDKQFCFNSSNGFKNISFELDDKLKKNSIQVKTTLENTKTVNGIVVFREVRTVINEYPISKKCSNN
jgi:hypothetical protein